METKVCTKCGEEKLLSEFAKDSRAKDGKQIKCKGCDKAYREDNKKRIAKYKQQWHNRNRNEILKKQKLYYEANKERLISNVAAYRAERLANDPVFKTAKNYRNRTQLAIKGHGFTKSGTSRQLLGCTWEKLVEHLESQFVDGMSWDNRSEWHIDHIIPLASAETEEELLALCHYTNLQPLWAKDNLSKGAKIYDDSKG